MPKYINKEVCRDCGGKCCKRLPGCCLPSDIGSITVNRLVKLLKTGKYSIDWWEIFKDDNGHDAPGYFIRPATKNADNTIKDPSWGGECIFLTNKGCSLTYNKRPFGCRQLEPKKDNKCASRGGGEEKYDSAVAWDKYKCIIDDVLNKLRYGD